MTKILITGASGLIGKKLTTTLLEKNYDVVHLGRGAKHGAVKHYQWDVDRNYIEKGALDNVDVIIHLAGAGIADEKWTEKRKREILESRTYSTRLIFNELKKGGHQVKTFISASAIGYYGFGDSEKLFTEDDAPGTDFLAYVVKKWEEEVDEIAALNIRVAKIRIGIVLSMQGGALAEIAKPVNNYVGAPLGTGDQYISWIHIDDLCAMFETAINDPRYIGAFNGVAHQPVTNRELTKAIAKVLQKPLIVPFVPAFALRIVFGEMANLILKGNKVSNEKIERLGFQFRYDTLDAALSNLLRHS